MTTHRFFISLFILLMAHSSFASFISIRTTTRAPVEENRINLEISMANRGDEAAYNLQAEIVFEKETYFTARTAQLDPDQTISFTRSIEMPPSKRGEYPLVVVAHYTDANQYPFSALSCITVSNKSDAPPSDLFGNMDAVSLSTTGRVVLTVNNKGEKDLSTSIRLFAPGELKIITPRKQVSIPAGSQKKISFDTENFSALGGSTYQIYAVAEYETEGVHHTGIIPGSIAVTESRDIAGIHRTVVLTILILCTLIFAAAQYIKRK